VPDQSDWTIAKLGAKHKRSDFDCGEDSLNQYLHRFARQNQDSGISAAYVALLSSSNEVHGYYTISAGSLDIDQIPDDLAKRLPRYPVPTALIGRLAVDRNAQGMGLGELLLMDAINRIVRTAEELGIHAVEVSALNDAAKNFYRKYGFIELLDDAHHLYLPIKTFKRLRLN